MLPGQYSKGQEVEAVVLAVDPERERISLGVKQLDQDPFATFMAANPKGSIVKGIIREVDARGATIELGDGVSGYLKGSDISTERVEDASKVLAVNDEIEAKFTGIDRRSRLLTLSIKAKEDAELADVLVEYQKASAGTTSLGDLLKEQMDRGQSEAED